MGGVTVDRGEAEETKSFHAGSSGIDIVCFNGPGVVRTANVSSPCTAITHSAEITGWNAYGLMSTGPGTVGMRMDGKGGGAESDGRANGYRWDANGLRNN